MILNFFRNQSFIWLLENALGYVAKIVASTELEIADNKDVKKDSNWVNKMALTKYIRFFKEGKEAVDLKKKEIIKDKGK